MTQPHPARHSASQWRLVWWRFRRHRLAMAGAVVLAVAYLVALFAEFVAPYSTEYQQVGYGGAPPQVLKVVDTSPDGWDWGLYVNGYTDHVDQETLEITYEVDHEQRVPVRFFAEGESYKLFGLFETDRHLIGPADPEGPPVFFLGATANGYDLFSRIVHGARVSLTIGLVGVAASFVIGVVLGGISGYVGGWVDTVIQRLIEFFMSIPTLPLWLGLAAAVPTDWGPMQRYFTITVILSAIAWTDLARVVRGRFMALREEDFVTATALDGVGPPRLIFGHMLPSFTSHLIASTTLAIPAMILAETALSFLGLGLRAPAVSWGTLLEEAQNFATLQAAPWLLLPGAAVVVVVLSFNFVGDGLRDAADPYKS
ncbi:ABC transporter permease [Phytoactinopolyspora endophytica]|uniref:ABC transporter permease n=1 Tax=Phytoactinopolyspora endophytica TaxID=1642495 RepID=UPI00101C8B38|nr:ABC transporter permease [Phytoactinopolyspora endophytica]